MRAIRQSDIDIAKAEVEILRSLGMEPDEDALLLASLDEPPAVTTKEHGAEPVVEVNGQHVQTSAAGSGDDSEIFGGELILTASTAGEQQDEYDISVVVPPSDENTLMRLYLGSMLSTFATDRREEGKGSRRFDVVARRVATEAPSELELLEKMDARLERFANAKARHEEIRREIAAQLLQRGDESLREYLQWMRSHPTDD